jgi:putative membrane protein
MLHWMCAFAALAILIAAYRPVSFLDWALENALAFVCAVTLALAYRRVPLSDASYLMLAIFLGLHEFGAHYKYSDVPVGEWMKSWVGTSRNDFDRVVHFAYGLLCSYPLQELAMRTGIRNAWRSVIPIASILAFSALYEMLEAAMAGLVPPALSNDFSGLQGDIWDAQKDMFMAGLGAVVAVTTVAWLRYRRVAYPVVDRSLVLAARAE